MVLPAVVASETEAYDGRRRRRELVALTLVQLLWLLLPRRRSRLGGLCEGGDDGGEDGGDGCCRLPLEERSSCM